MVFVHFYKFIDNIHLKIIQSNYLPNYIKNISGFVSVFVMICLSILFISLLTFFFLFIINRLGRFAGFLLNKKHKEPLDKLYREYAKEVSNDTHYENYALNKKHRQRQNKTYKFYKLPQSDSELSNWVDSFIFLELEKYKMVHKFKKLLHIITIVFFICIFIFVTRFILLKDFILTTKIIVILNFFLFYKFSVDGINNFKVSGYRLNHMNYKKMIEESKFKTQFEKRIHCQLNINK